MLKNTQGNFCQIVYELLKAEQIFAVWRESELIMTYLTKNQFGFTYTLVRKSETRMFPILAIERECLLGVSIEILLEISFPDFTSIVAADGDICLFGGLKPFACSCLVG